MPNLPSPNEGFESLTPDLILGSVERALDRPMTGLTSPLPSYINRVYELETRDGERFVAKFYRPGRWNDEALSDEHRFVLDCAAHEIPVVAPLELADGKTLGLAGTIRFAVYPKRWGREIEITGDEDYRRLGRLIARVHLAGEAQKAPARVVLHPALSLEDDVRSLLDGGFVTPPYQDGFKRICREIIDLGAPLFDGVEMLRLHGDCHVKNFLDRPGEGLMIIDFDDMVTGPPVQDLWMLLPDHASRCRYEMNLLVSGYEEFREFDDRTLRLIEPLRAMRIIYFLSWCSRQKGDYKFRTLFPDWGSDRFWSNEIRDLEQQLVIVRNDLRSGAGNV